jgi:hypothetical protein
MSLLLTGAVIRQSACIQTHNPRGLCRIKLIFPNCSLHGLLSIIEKYHSISGKGLKKISGERDNPKSD